MQPSTIQVKIKKNFKKVRITNKQIILTYESLICCFRYFCSYMQFMNENDNTIV